MSAPQEGSKYGGVPIKVRSSLISPAELMILILPLVVATDVITIGTGVSYIQYSLGILNEFTRIGALISNSLDSLNGHPLLSWYLCITLWLPKLPLDGFITNLPLLGSSLTFIVASAADNEKLPIGLLEVIIASVKLLHNLSPGVMTMPWDSIYDCSWFSTIIDFIEEPLQPNSSTTLYSISYLFPATIPYNLDSEVGTPVVGSIYAPLGATPPSKDVVPIRVQVPAINGG